MAWPFSNAVAPSFNTTLMAVPTPSSTAVDTTSPIWLLGAFFSNPTAAAINVTVTDSAGNQIVPTTEVPAGMPFQAPFGFLPCAGLKWYASASGLLGQLWGYK